MEQQNKAHIPVMLEECLEGLNMQAGAWMIDGTFGAGGHTRALLDHDVNVIAIDQDPQAEQYFKNDYFEALGADRFRFVAGNFRHLDTHIQTLGIPQVSGILLDLGISSMQIDEAERGFAFRQSGPLDMRMGSEGASAADVVNSYSQEELASIIYKYGEERHSRRIARVIVERREEKPFETTDDLVTAIQRAYPKGQRRDHPARRTFQALRIFVNDELGALEDALVAAEAALTIGGRLVVMSYHSLEDRIVKHFVRNSPHLSAITKRPLTASEDEQAQNPRSRSAKLRVAERVEVST